MAGILFDPIGRRKFMVRSAVAAATVMMTRPHIGQGWTERNETLHLALLSDTHIPADSSTEKRGFRPWENLKTIVPEIVAATPDGVILNGDAAYLTGELDDYEALKALMRPITELSPIYIGFGNHDNRSNFFEVIDLVSGDLQPVVSKHVVAIEHPTVRVLVLDSLLYVNKVAGLLGKAQRTWLAQYLQETDDRPTVFFVHHTLDDRDSDLLDVDSMFHLIRRHSKVKAIFYGHSHAYRITEQQGVHLINIPAVGYNFEDNQPVGWVDAQFHSEGVNLTLRAFAGNLDSNGETTMLKWND